MPQLVERPSTGWAGNFCPFTTNTVIYGDLPVLYGPLVLQVEPVEPDPLKVVAVAIPVSP
jgi:hypothetical protein